MDKISNKMNIYIIKYKNPMVTFSTLQFNREKGSINQCAMFNIGYYNLYPINDK